MTQAQFKMKLQEAKVSKFKKIQALQDAIINLQATKEGTSALLSESLDTLLKILPQEHVFQAGNNWEVKP